MLDLSVCEASAVKLVPEPEPVRTSTTRQLSTVVVTAFDGLALFALNTFCTSIGDD